MSKILVNHSKRINFFEIRHILQIKNDKKNYQKYFNIVWKEKGSKKFEVCDKFCETKVKHIDISKGIHNCYILFYCA